MRAEVDKEDVHVRKGGDKKGETKLEMEGWSKILSALGLNKQESFKASIEY